MSLRSVVCQHLLPSADEGEKRVLALEVLHVNQPVQVAIRAGKIETIESAIQTGKRDGMFTLDDDLQRFCSRPAGSPLKRPGATPKIRTRSPLRPAAGRKTAAPRRFVSVHRVCVSSQSTASVSFASTTSVWP